MSKETTTMRVAYHFYEKHMENGRRLYEWDQSDGEALAEACTHLETPAISILQLPANDYIHRDVLSPGPNKSKRNAPNVLSTCAFLVMVEIVAGLIWLVAR